MFATQGFLSDIHVKNILWILWIVCFTSHKIYTTMIKISEMHKNQLINNNKKNKLDIEIHEHTIINYFALFPNPNSVNFLKAAEKSFKNLSLSL